VCLVHLSNVLQQFVGLLRSKVDVGEILNADAVFTRLVVTKQRLDAVGAE